MDPVAEKPDTALIWGLHTVQEALEHSPRSISEVLVQKGKGGARLQELISLAREQGVRVRFIEGDHLPVPRQSPHQGVVARQSAVALLPLDELLQPADGSGKPGRLLVLDSLQDPHNLGAILRTALAAGFSSVILTRERSAPLSGTVAKVAAGALARLHISQVTNLADALERVKRAGFWVYGAIADPSATSIYQMSLAPPLCLVIGSEERGIRPLVQKHCDCLLTIPMDSGFNSLNASVAAGVIMFEVVRQQQGPGPSPG